MSEPTQIQLQIKLNGGAPQTGQVTADFEDEVVLKLANTSGVKKAKYRIHEYPEGFACPAGWTNSNGIYQVIVANGGDAPSFTLPTAVQYFWGKYHFDVEVNERKHNGSITNALYDKSTNLQIVSDSGIEDIAFGEGDEWESASPTVRKRSWARAVKALVRRYDGSIPGTGDVTGDTSSTSGHLARMHGTGGKDIRDAGLSLTDIGQAFNVKTYGAAPAASAATNQAALAAALAAATAAKGVVFIGNPGVYLLSARVTIDSNTTLVGVPGVCLKLANGANNFVITIAEGAENVTIRDIEIDGNKDNNPTGATGIQNEDDTARNVKIENVWVHHCMGAGVRLAGDNVTVTNCTFEYNEVSGFAGDLLQYFRIAHCYARDNGTHGIGLIGTCHHGVISDNTCEHNGVGDPFADDYTGYGSTITYVIWANNVSRNALNNGLHVGGDFVVVIGNNIEDAANYGLVMRNDGLVPDMNGAMCIGNSVSHAGTQGSHSGIWLGNNQDFICSNNNVIGSWANGIWLQEGCADGIVANNNVTRSGEGAGSGQGIRVDDATDVSFIGNRVRGSLSRGLQMTNCVNCTIAGGNSFKTNASPLTINGTSSGNKVIGNNFTGNTSDTPSINAGTVDYWANNPNGGTNDLASAGTLTFPAYTDKFRVTGTTPFTAITASWNEREVTLRFSGNITITSQTGLFIHNGTFTSGATGGATLRLMYLGSAWYETGRSIPV